MKLRFLDLATTDPAFNLAAEEYVFECLPRDAMYVMLWQNDNAIIIGKHQNTLAEINEAFVQAQGIRVVRRLSGGGAVGRKLDFLLQEMNREANTIGSKCTDVKLARIVVDIKAELEKIREQTQNIE